MPKITLTVEQILDAAGIVDNTGQYNIKIADFVKTNLPSEIVVNVSEDQVEADPVTVAAPEAAPAEEIVVPSEEEAATDVPVEATQEEVTEAPEDGATPAAEESVA